MMDYKKRCYQAYVTTHFQHFHALSDREFEHILKIYRKRFSRFLPADKAALIIDVACGSGHFLYFLKKTGYKNAIGIDLSREQVEQAQKKGIANVKKADLFKYLLKFPNHFQMIIANDIIEHLKKEEIIKFLDLIYLALKPGGKVIMTTLNSASLFGALLLFDDFTHETGFAPNSLSQVMRVCNFKNIEIIGEKPIIYDFRSMVRSYIWGFLKIIFKSYMLIACGTGRGLWKTSDIFEPRMFAVGSKKVR